MKRSLFSFCQVLGLPLPEKDIQFNRVILDSKEVEEGDLFIAIEGKRSSGRDFIPEALQRGAKAVMVTEGLPFEGKLQAIIVPDVCKALQTLAKRYLPQKAIKICVTGSVGKTTTKEFIAILLEGKFKVGKTMRSYNSQYGFPTAVLNLEGDEEVLVLEMSMTDFGHIRSLVEIAVPDIAVITRVGRSHMELVGGIQGVGKAKAEILSDPRTKKCILNYQCMDFAPIAKEKKETTTLFSLDNPMSDLYLQRKGEKGRFCEKGKMSPYFVLPFPYEHFLENLTCAAGVARMMDMSWDEILARIPLLKTVAKRFEIVEKYGITFVNDSYNAGPEAVRAAILNMPRPKKGGKVIGVLGEMPELGDESRSVHIEIAQIALSKLDQLLCYGKNTEPMVEVFCENKRPAVLISDRELLKKKIREIALPGDVVLIKGANILQMWKILEEI